jgi:hypothetical protein
MRQLIVFGVAAALLAVGGCVRASAPASISIGGPPPPPAYVAPADPNSRPDLLRENQQLRDRVAWLEDRNRKRADKYNNDLAKDIEEIRADMRKIADERDRYRRAAGM